MSKIPITPFFNSLTLLFSMVYCHISAHMKCRALQLLAEGWDAGEITKALGVCERSIDR